jgi:uncharacterized membrane protein
MKRRLASLLIALVVLVVASTALAQHSGSSFGGGDFSGGGGGYDGGGYHESGYSGGGGAQGLAYLIVLGIQHPPLGMAMIAILVIVLYVRGIGNAARGGALPGPQARAWMNVDVSVVRIAVDATSRLFLQNELAKIATHGTAQSYQLLASLQRVVRLLRKCDAAWIFGGSSNYHPMSPPIAEGVFRRHAQEARAKFSVELVRNVGGQTSTQASSGYTPREAEGEGVALVTLVVAARREIRDFFGGRRDEIHAVLEDLERLTPRELVAIEIVWMPADPSDRISSATLQALDTTLVKLPGAIGGRVNCAYCRGPFAAELPTCPHCGAPAKA